MVSVNSDTKSFSYLSNFRQHVCQNSTMPTISNKTTLTDTFINSIKKQEEIDTKGTWATRNFSSLSAITPLIFAYIYDMGQLGKIAGSPKGEFKQTALKSLKKMAIATTICSIANYALNKYFESKTNTNYENLVEKFNELNTDTNAKPADKMIYSGTAEALYNPMSGKIQFNKNMVNDPIVGRNIDKKIKHELVHAKQYETVACSKDGIKKVNFAVMNQVKKNIEKSNVKEVFDKIFTDLQNNGDKYNNTKITIMGGAAEVNLKDYITALHTMLNKSDTTYNDIPIVIDSAHYQEVINKRGKLTAEEEAKADEYYKAMLDYEPVNMLGALNPWSDYRQNILEKEAYKENPSIITKLSDMFSK